MEIQLQELIEQIKKNGVEVAENEAASILESANSEAERIISEAKAEAERITSRAKVENERIVRVSEEAIRQAGRNILLSFRESVAKELEAVIGEQVTALYSSAETADLIAKVVEACSKNADVDDITVLLGEKDSAALEEAVLAAFKAHMLNGVTLKSNDQFDGGFRVSVNNGRAYYDYSVEAVTEMLSAYLTPKMVALLKEAEKE